MEILITFSFFAKTIILIAGTWPALLGFTGLYAQCNLSSTFPFCIFFRYGADKTLFLFLFFLIPTDPFVRPSGAAGAVEISIWTTVVVIIIMIICVADGAPMLLISSVFLPLRPAPVRPSAALGVF